MNTHFDNSARQRHEKDTMSHFHPRPGLALTATTALLIASGSALVGPALSAAAVTPNILEVKITPGGTPGQALTGTVKVTDSNGKPVSGEQVDLTVDHGFFTSGKPVSSNKGDLVGNLVESGQTYTNKTGSDGTAPFQIGIKRDTGFDDDGQVMATVTAVDGAVSKTGTTTWSSADPLNGGSVDVTLSTRQDHPVAPTVTSDLTYYHVTTRDQFKNPVDNQPVELLSDKLPPDTEYGESSFFNSKLEDFGDFWVVSDKPRTLTTEVAWADAPVNVYDAAGAPAQPTVRDVTGKASVNYYDVNFNASSYSLTSSAPSDTVVGSTVTQTVTVTDQLGRPVRGYDVEFFRFGPDTNGGDRKGEDQTNELGQASYSYVGSSAGTAKVSAVVSDGLSQRTLIGSTTFRYNVPAGLKAAKGKGKKSAGKDVLQVSADPHAAGAAVSVFRVVGGTLKPVPAKGGALDGSGQATLKVKDKNGKKATTYVVTVQPTAVSYGATSAPTKVR